MEDHDYSIALELAQTAKYKEARQKLLTLLSEKPDHVDALILLGKVEYYLNHYSESSKQFETALLYDPHNISAYFALDFYKQRKKHFFLSSLFLTAFIVIIILMVSFSIVIHLSVKKIVTEQASIQSSSIEEITTFFKEDMKTIHRTLEGIDQKINKLSLKAANNTLTLNHVKNDINTISMSVKKIIEESKAIKALLIEQSNRLFEIQDRMPDTLE
jgi:tetratricopeptide (TPR) repeat protein